MTSSRTKFAALGLVTAILVLTGGAVFAQAGHPYCAAKEHDCGRTTKISRCCCGDQDGFRTDSVPVQARIQVVADMSPAPAVPRVVAVCSAPQRLHGIEASPPRFYLLDLPTLFATLLI